MPLCRRGGVGRAQARLAGGFGGSRAGTAGGAPGRVAFGRAHRARFHRRGRVAEDAGGAAGRCRPLGALWGDHSALLSPRSLCHGLHGHARLPELRPCRGVWRRAARRDGAAHRRGSRRHLARAPGRYRIGLPNPYGRPATPCGPRHANDLRATQGRAQGGQRTGASVRACLGGQRPGCPLEGPRPACRGAGAGRGGGGALP